MHGGGPKVTPGAPLAKEYTEENLELLEKGTCNLFHHVNTIKKSGINPVVCINRFYTDTDAEIALLKPDSKAGMTVNEALENRRSWREYAPEALSLEELSGVMWAAGGVNRPADGRLTAPSALALYPVRVYAFSADERLQLRRQDAETRARRRSDLRRLAGAQDFVYAAPLNLVYIADMSAYEGKNIPAEHVRYLCGQDAAGYAENVNLYTAGHGLKSITRGSAPEAELLKALGLDPGRYFMALAQTVGK